MSLHRYIDTAPPGKTDGFLLHVRRSRLRLLHPELHAVLVARPEAARQIFYSEDCDSTTFASRGFYDDNPPIITISLDDTGKLGRAMHDRAALRSHPRGDI